MILTRDFEIQANVVTQWEYSRLMGENPSMNVHPEDCKRSFRNGMCPDNPVETISWIDAAQYANALSRANGREECYSIDESTNLPSNPPSIQTVHQSVYDCDGYRLPTEAEWEYAARAGSTTSYEFVSDDPDEPRGRILSHTQKNLEARLPGLREISLVSRGTSNRTAAQPESPTP